MVVFTCNHCGDSLHKPKVEKHYSFVCRTGKSLTCVDCLKDFRGEDYSTHTKCVTEEERYSAKGSIPGGIVKKGDLKQESWMEMLKKISDQEGLRAPIRNLMKTMLTHSNIPRKKTKFMNFIKSSSGGRVNMNDVEEAWNIIESYKNEQQAVETNGLQGEGKTHHENSKEEVNSNQNGIHDNTGETKSKKKKKQRDSSVAEINGNEEKPNEVQNEETDEKPKKKTKQSPVEETEVQPNITPIENDATNVKEKKKKKKHSSVEGSEDNPNITANEDDTTNIKAKTKKNKKDSSAEETVKQTIINTNEEDTPKVEKKKKKKLDNQDRTVNGDNPRENGADETVPAKKPKIGTDEVNFDFKENILTVLTGKESIPLKKLEKKVLKAYRNFSGEGECSPKVIKKFNKTLKRLDNIEVSNDLVLLKK